MTTNELTRTILNAALDRKAHDIVLLRVDKVTSLADYYIICTGTSTTQLRAIADAADEAVSKAYGVDPQSVEGYRGSPWVLLDYGTVILHVFKEDTRRFYDLERLWADGTRVDVEAFLAGKDTTCSEQD